MYSSHLYISIFAVQFLMQDVSVCAQILLLKFVRLNFAAKIILIKYSNFGACSCRDWFVIQYPSFA